MHYKYIKLILPYFSIALLIFTLSILGGVLASVFYPQIANLLLSEARDFVEPLMNMSQLELTIFIFLNNLLKILGVAALGVFVGLMPIVFLISNGALIGSIGVLTVQEIGILYFLIGILPHGIIEIPVAIFGAGIGLRFGHLAIYKLKFGIKRKVGILKEAKQAAKIFGFVLMPLVLLAALIEVYLTPLLLNL